MKKPGYAGLFDGARLHTFFCSSLYINAESCRLSRCLIHQYTVQDLVLCIRILRIFRHSAVACRTFSTSVAVFAVHEKYAAAFFPLRSLSILSGLGFSMGLGWHLNQSVHKTWLEAAFTVACPTPSCGASCGFVPYPAAGEFFELYD